MVGTFPLVDQLADRFFYRHDAGCPPGIASGKGITVLKVSLESVIQGGHDAVGTSRDVASLDAVEGANLRLLQAVFHFLQEIAVDSSSRHADRTLDNLDILFFRFDVAFFESVGSVALGSGDETGS